LYASAFNLPYVLPAYLHFVDRTIILQSYRYIPLECMVCDEVSFRIMLYHWYGLVIFVLMIISWLLHFLIVKHVNPALSLLYAYNPAWSFIFIFVNFIMQYVGSSSYAWFRAFCEPLASVDAYNGDIFIIMFLIRKSRLKISEGLHHTNLLKVYVNRRCITILMCISMNLAFCLGFKVYL